MLRTLGFVAAAILAGVPTSGYGQSALDNCADQFIGGTVENAPKTAASASTGPSGANRHLCYRDDGVSFYALEYWPQQFAPRWAAYRLDPANYGPGACNVYPRGKANCYFSKTEWSDFETCKDAGDPFHADLMLDGEKLGPDAFDDSGHDAGHTAPRQAFSWHVCGTYQTFTMANMSAQAAALNQGVWRFLERQVLTWAIDEGPIYVVTGTIFGGFPAKKFDVYNNRTFDPSRIYSPGTTLLQAATQIAKNVTAFPKKHILHPKREAVPKDIKDTVKNLQVPTGYYQVVYRPAVAAEPAHAIGFLLPHTFEDLGRNPAHNPQQAFWAFVSRIDVIEEVSGTQFPGIPADLKRKWGDGFFQSRRTGREISKGCTGTPQGVVENSTKQERLAFCTDHLN